MRVRAVYKLPELRQIILITSPCKIQDSPKLSRLHKQGKEVLEDIRNCKGRISPKRDQKWSIKVVLEEDFLQAIEGLQEIKLLGPNQSYDNSENMELLAINLLQTPSKSSDLSFNTPKILSKVPNEDIIEVFV